MKELGLKARNPCRQSSAKPMPLGLFVWALTPHGNPSGKGGEWYTLHCVPTFLNSSRNNLIG